MKRRWTLEEKLAILKEAAESNIIETCRKHNVSTGTFYNWRKKFEAKGEAGLKANYETKSNDLKKAEDEIRILRKLLADREIELEVQRELLKKSLEPTIQISHIHQETAKIRWPL